MGMVIITSAYLALALPLPFVLACAAATAADLVLCTAAYADQASTGCAGVPWDLCEVLNAVPHRPAGLFFVTRPKRLLGSTADRERMS